MDVNRYRHRHWTRSLIGLLAVAALLPCAGEAGEPLTVAVASNFLRPAAEISAEFTRQSGVPVRLSSGSTGKLYAQIVNGAPFDVFLAADTDRPRRLIEDGLAREDSFTVYARGTAVLWSADPMLKGSDCWRALRRDTRSKFAIANPATAPYGMLASRLLQDAGLWTSLADRTVYGESISQAFQFVATGNARFGIVAASLLQEHESATVGCQAPLSAVSGGERSRLTVAQAAVALNRTRRAPQTERFMRFLAEAEARSILQRFGYVSVADIPIESIP